MSTVKQLAPLVLSSVVIGLKTVRSCTLTTPSGRDLNKIPITNQEQLQINCQLNV